MKLYHYTATRNLDSIKEKGLLNIYGEIFFTSSETTEPTVNWSLMQEQGRVMVEISEEYKKVTDTLETDYNLMASYFSPTLIGLITDISEWYHISRKVKPSEIINYETLKDGEWIDYEN